MLGLFKAVRALPGADQMIAKEKEKMIRNLEKTLHGHLDMEKRLTIPAEGVAADRIIAMMMKMKEREDPKWKGGRVSGGIYGQAGHAAADKVKLAVSEARSQIRPSRGPPFPVRLRR